MAQKKIDLVKHRDDLIARISQQEQYTQNSEIAMFQRGMIPEAKQHYNNMASQLSGLYARLDEFYKLNPQLKKSAPEIKKPRHFDMPDIIRADSWSSRYRMM